MSLSGGVFDYNLGEFSIDIYIIPSMKEEDIVANKEIVKEIEKVIVNYPTDNILGSLGALLKSYTGEEDIFSDLYLKYYNCDSNSELVDKIGDLFLSQKTGQVAKISILSFLIGKVIEDLVDYTKKKEAEADNES